MSDQPVPERPVYIRDEIETVSVRRAPKYGVFMLAGAFLGILAALILTVAIDGANVSPYTQVAYSQLQVFGFTALICVVIGISVAAVAALVFERVLNSRTRLVTVDHEQYEV